MSFRTVLSDPMLRMLVTAIALIALAGWTALFVIARGPDSFTRMAPNMWADAIIAWSVPAPALLSVQPFLAWCL